MPECRFKAVFTVDRFLRAIFSGLVLLCCASLAYADDDFLVRGFGTLGMARTTTDDVEFVRDLSQARGLNKQWSGAVDSVLGLQANWRLTPQLEAVVQGMSRYSNHRNFKPETAWAYLKYEPLPNLSLRAGHLGTEFLMEADSRWVGYSLLTVRPVGDYFWYLPFYGINGGDATVTHSFGDTVLRGKVFYGKSTGHIPLADLQWDISGSPMAGAYLETQHGPWQLRATYANLRFTHDLPLPAALTPAQNDFLHAENTRSHYYSLGLIYENGPWQGQLMLNHIIQGSRALESSDAGYGLLGYRVGQVTPYVGYSWVRSHRRSENLDAVTQFIMEDSHTDQTTRILGMRWDFAPRMALKGQWDGVRGMPSSLLPYRMDNRAQWDGKLDVFSLTLDFIF